MKGCLQFGRTVLIIAACWLLTPGSLKAQVALTGNEYLENFDNLATGLPHGWSVHTGAGASLLGESVTAGTDEIAWSQNSGGFKNYASAEGLTSSSGTSDQAGSSNRALGVRQVAGSNNNFPNSDPGAAFVLHLANTAGLKNFLLSFKLSSLDPGSDRNTSWVVQYGTRDGENYLFESVGNVYVTGGGLWNTREVTVDFENKLDNIAESVWVRIVALSGSSGSGSRPSTAIDDFRLTYATSNSNEPTLHTSPGSLSAFSYDVGEGPSEVQSYQIQASNLPDPEGNITVMAPAGYEISLQNDAGFTSSLLVPYEDGALVSRTVFVRLKAGLPTGPYSGENITHSVGSLSANVSLSGGVNDPNSACGAVIIPIAGARASALRTIVTIKGRVTAVTMANHNIYLKDGNGPSDGILVFDNGLLRPGDLAVGDEVEITGMRAEFNGMAQLSGVSCFERVSDRPDNVSPVPANETDLCSYQGQLVSVAGVAFPTETQTLSGNTTYTSTNGTVIYIHNNTGIGGSGAPQGAVTVTGIVTVFQGVCQLTPRFLDDIPGATPPAPCGLPLGQVTNNETQLEVVNWNVEWLGHSSNGTGAAQLANVLNGVRSMQADVYMLQEVCSYNAAEPGDPNTALGAIIQALNTAYPSRSYTGECSSAYSYSYIDNPDPQGQRVCIVYRTDQVKKVSSKPLMQEIYDEGVEAYPTGSSSQFWSSGRLPFLLEADVTIEGYQPARVHFITLHSKANTGDQLESYRRRQYDHKVFYNYLQTEYPSANIIMAGDFNDDFDQSIYQYGSSNISSWSPFLYSNPDEVNVNGVRPNDNWNALTYKFSGTGCSSSHGYATFIDHVVVSDEIAFSSPSARIAASGELQVTTVETIRGTVSSGTGRASDHFPTFTRYELVTPLPVRLVSFEAFAEAGNRAVSISWVTAEEKSSSHFEIEKSRDGRSFYRIGKVTGAGESGNLLSYIFSDPVPGEGVIYYRLRMIDQDGSNEVSQIVSVSLLQDVHIYPNPAVGFVSITGVNEESAWTLYNVYGRAVKRGTGSRVDLSDHHQGIYMLMIELQPGIRIVRKIVKS